MLLKAYSKLWIKYENRKKRLYIYPKKIQRITGKSYRQSIKLLQRIRKDLNKLL